MIKIPMDVYMQTLAELIEDEDKLVTYKWLSKELEVHVNTAKQMLAEYWKKHKADGISATFMLIGNTKDGGMRVEVVKDCDLEKSIEKFEKVISQHLYSLQKVLPDIDALAKSGKGDAKFGAIKCKECVILSDEELFERRWGSVISYQPRIVEQKQEKKKENPIPKEKKEDEPKEKKPEDKPEEKEEEKVEAKSEVKKVSPSSKPKPADKKLTGKKPVQSTKAGFSNLFGKVSNQKKSPPSKPINSLANGSDKESIDKKEEKIEKTSKSTEEKETPMEVEELPSPKEISKKSVFNSSNSESKKQKKSPKEDNTKKSQLNTSNKKEKEDKPKEPKESPALKKPSPKEDSKIDNKKAKSSEKAEKKTDRGKKRERSQENKGSIKKRKRIVVMDSSEEEDVSGKDDNEEEEPDLFDMSFQNEAPAKIRSPSPPVTEEIGGKRKVRKTVDKTFVDDDGYMVTKKIQVMESASEEDEPVVAQPKKKVAEITKPATSLKGKKISAKQTTLTSFFKKA